MHGDFRPLIHPGTDAQDIDIEGTRAYRQRMHQAIRAQQLAFPFADMPIPPVPDTGDPESTTRMAFRRVQRVLVRQLQVRRRPRPQP